MTDRQSQEDRTGYLISQLVDGEPSREALDELNELVLSDTSSASLVVDHLILDSLLSEDLSRDSLATLIDLVADPEVTAASLNSDTDAVHRKTRLAPNGRRRPTSWYLRSASWIVAVAALILVVAIIAGRTEKEAFADATANCAGGSSRSCGTGGTRLRGQGRAGRPTSGTFCSAKGRARLDPRQQLLGGDQELAWSSMFRTRGGWRDLGGSWSVARHAH